MRKSEYTGSVIGGHRFNVAAIVLFALVSRLPYLPTGFVGFEGPAYINALNHDHTLNVPPPGLNGSLLLATFFSLFTSDSIIS